MDFVPAEFDVPKSYDCDDFSLVPLTPSLNSQDYRSWTSSIEHIRDTPGFEDSDWPHEMSREQNLEDLVRHEQDFLARRGFTYSVIRDGDVIGCVYIYPAREHGVAAVRSWVDLSNAVLDGLLYSNVKEWLASRWPFEGTEYAVRTR